MLEVGRGRDRAGEERGRDPHRRAHRGAQDRGTDDQRDDVVNAVEAVTEPDPGQQEPSEERLGGVADRDREGETDRDRRHRVREEGSDEDGRPHLLPEEQ